MVDRNIYIVQGEISTIVGAIKRNARWSMHTPLVRPTYSYYYLKCIFDLSRLKL